MAGPRVAAVEVRRVLVGFAVVVCGWWLSRAALLTVALADGPRLPEAFWWRSVALVTTDLVAAGATVLSARGLLHGSRHAWRVSLGLVTLLVVEGVALLRIPGLGATVMLVGMAGLGLLLAGRSRLHSSVVPCAAPVARGVSKVRRRSFLALGIPALLIWYGVVAVNALIGAGKIRVADHPPCDSSAAYTSQTKDLARWMLEEGRAGRVPIDGIGTAVCSSGSWIPGVATGDINTGGVPAVRARLEQLGCVWHANCCTVTLGQTHAKARLHDGHHPTLELWPAR